MIKLQTQALMHKFKAFVVFTYIDIPFTPYECISQAVSDSKGAGIFGTQLSAGCIIRPQLQRSSLRYPSGPFQLTASPRGSLANVMAKPLANANPGPGQILLRVQAVGVNFRDVLNVLGMYPGDPGEPGGDVAGIVEAVGSGRCKFK